MMRTEPSRSFEKVVDGEELSTEQKRVLEQARRHVNHLFEVYGPDASIISYEDYRKLSRIRSQLVSVFGERLKTETGSVDWDRYRVFWRRNVLRFALPSDYYELEYGDVE